MFKTTLFNKELFIWSLSRTESSPSWRIEAIFGLNSRQNRLLTHSCFSHGLWLQLWFPHTLCCLVSGVPFLCLVGLLVVPDRWFRVSYYTAIKWLSGMFHIINLFLRLKCSSSIAQYVLKTACHHQHGSLSCLWAQIQFMIDFKWPFSFHLLFADSTVSSGSCFGDLWDGDGDVQVIMRWPAVNNSLLSFQETYVLLTRSSEDHVFFVKKWQSLWGKHCDVKWLWIKIFAKRVNVIMTNHCFLDTW